MRSFFSTHKEIEFKAEFSTKKIFFSLEKVRMKVFDARKSSATKMLSVHISVTMRRKVLYVHVHRIYSCGQMDWSVVQSTLAPNGEPVPKCANKLANDTNVNAAMVTHCITISLRVAATIPIHRMSYSAIERRSVVLTFEHEPLKISMLRCATQLPLTFCWTIIRCKYSGPM